MVACTCVLHNMLLTLMDVPASEAAPLVVKVTEQLQQSGGWLPAAGQTAALLDLLLNRLHG
jgi:hypothetical protein